MKYIWENPQIIKENKQDGHALALPQKTAESATERKASPFKISMNGEWKYHSFPVKFIKKRKEHNHEKCTGYPWAKPEFVGRT